MKEILIDLTVGHMEFEEDEATMDVEFYRRSRTTGPYNREILHHQLDQLLDYWERHERKDN